MRVRVGYSNLVSGMSLRPSAWKVVIFFGKEHLNCHMVGKESGEGKVRLQKDLNLPKEHPGWPSPRRAPGPAVTLRTFQSRVCEGVQLPEPAFGLRSGGVVLGALIASGCQGTLFVSPNADLGTWG